MICKKCSNFFKTRYRLNGKEHNLANRRYCLDCSPFKRHNTLKLEIKENSDPNFKICAKCKENLPLSNFYKSQKYWCKKCTNNQTLLRQRDLKLNALKYLGGKCILCNYKKYDGSLEFHHLVSFKKEYAISHSHTKSFEKIKPELDKCVILCSNCHKEVHAGISFINTPNRI